MKTASELRKSLDEALKPDTSGKTTPIQRLTPFLRELVDYLEAQETYIQAHDGSTTKYPCGCTFGFTADGYVQTICEKHEKEIQVSSNAATQAVPASPTNEPGDASKASA